MVALASILSAALYIVVAVAVPGPQNLGIQVTSTPSNHLPTLTLPYGTWRAASYDHINDVCFFG
jgi:hypothetical protein